MFEDEDTPFTKTKIIENLLKDEVAIIASVDPFTGETTTFFSEACSPVDLVWLIDSLRRRLDDLLRDEE